MRVIPRPPHRTTAPRSPQRTAGSADNEAVVLGADGSETPVPHGPKEDLADTVWDLVAQRLDDR
jgi:phosphopantothenoylcysteine synthetase/decarboxylase